MDALLVDSPPSRRPKAERCSLTGWILEWILRGFWGLRALPQVGIQCFSLAPDSRSSWIFQRHAQDNPGTSKKTPGKSGKIQGKADSERWVNIHCPPGVELLDCKARILQDPPGSSWIPQVFSNSFSVFFPGFLGFPSSFPAGRLAAARPARWRSLRPTEQGMRPLRPTEHFMRPRQGKGTDPRGAPTDRARHLHAPLASP